MADGGGHPEVVGVLKVREHCQFAWLERGFHRIVIVSSEHCPSCVAEVRRLGYALIQMMNGSADGGDGAGRQD